MSECIKVQHLFPHHYFKLFTTSFSSKQNEVHDYTPNSEITLIFCKIKLPPASPST